jgi:hypothetical protein
MRARHGVGNPSFIEECGVANSWGSLTSSAYCITAILGSNLNGSRVHNATTTPNSIVHVLSDVFILFAIYLMAWEPEEGRGSVVG